MSALAPGSSAPGGDAYAQAEQAAQELTARAGGPPDLAVVLGSGWRAVADALGPAQAEWAMDEITGFPAPTVPGHQGVVRTLWVAGRRVVVLLGRSHLYEGRTPAEVVHAVRTVVRAGARVVVLTNAAGALTPAYRPGQVVLVRDHINLTGASPLTGPEPPAGYGSRFVDLTDLYAARLRALARTVDPTLAEGVYAALRGPHYETPSEVAMLRLAGADLVGMSTALEAIAVRHLGASVLGLSLVTNLAAGVSPTPIHHTEVLAAGTAAVPRLAELFAALLPVLAAGPAA